MSDFEISKNEDDSVDVSVFDVMRDLEKAGTPGLVDRIINTYLETSQPYVSTIDSFQDKNDEEILHAVHTLKSSSANVGAFTLSKICTELENQVRGGRQDNFEMLAISAVTEFNVVTSALKKLLG